jgi:PAS domain S-box-containing protein
LQDGMFIDVNEGFTVHSGYTREDVIGKTVMEIDLWSDLADRDRMMKEIQTKGYCNNLEIRFKNKNGSSSTCLMSAKIILLHGVPHMIGIICDITERKQAEEILRQRNQELERFERLVVGRELRMVELKKQIASLKKQFDKLEKTKSKIKAKP